MSDISIHHALKALAPQLALGCVSARVSVEKYHEALWREIDQHLAHLTATIKPEQINSIPQVSATRSAYKSLGQRPFTLSGISGSAVAPRAFRQRAVPDQ
jgi:hypothetical protein